MLDHRAWPGFLLVMLSLLGSPGQSWGTELLQQTWTVKSDLARLSDAEHPSINQLFRATQPLGFSERATYDEQLTPASPSMPSDWRSARRLPLALLMDIPFADVSSEAVARIQAAQNSDAAHAVYFEDGPVFLRDIAFAFGKQTHQGTFGGEVKLTAPLILSSSALLVLQPGEHLVLDHKSGAFVFAAGGMILDQAAISSSSQADEDAAGFRPFVLVDATGPVEISDGSFSGLGFGRDAKTAGLTIMGGNAGDQHRSFVQDSYFTRTGALALLNTEGSTIRRNVFHDSIGTAFSVDGSASVVADGNAILFASGGHGVRVGAGSTKVVLSDNIIFGSAKHGILLERLAGGATVFNNLVFDNQGSGIAVLDSTCLVLEQNISLANLDDGIMIRRSAAVLLETNDVWANLRAGVSAGGSGSLTLKSSRMRANKVGLRADAGFMLTLHQNDWTGQVPRLLGGDAAGHSLALLASGETPITLGGVPEPLAGAAGVSSCLTDGAV